MAKTRKRGKQVKPPSEDEDSDAAAQNMSDPDSDGLQYDEIDSFHMKKDKVLLDQGASLEPADFSDDQDSVLGVDLDEDDDEEDDDYREQLAHIRKQKFEEELGSDLEQDDADSEDSIDGKSWGKRRSRFYGAENEDAAASGSEPETQALEEEEARRLQKKMAQELADQDFNMDIFKEAAKTDKDTTATTTDRVTTDLSQMSRTEKRRLLKKECPELLELIQQFKSRLEEVKKKLSPIHTLQKEGQLPESSGSLYVTTKLSLLLNYCINIGFYFILRARHQFTPHHPVVKRLVQYRNLLQQLEAVDVKIQPEMEKLLSALEDGKDINTLLVKKTPDGIKRRKLLRVAAGKRKAENTIEKDDSEAGEAPKSKSKKAKGKTYETTAEKEALDFYTMMKGSRKVRKNKEDDDDDADDEGDDEKTEKRLAETPEEMEMEEGKRAVTYQIAKNKGLKPKRKKEQSNPRVKHKMKYRKANIRRKGQVREVRKELTPYGGELSGIRAGIKRSVKLK